MIARAIPTVLAAALLAAPSAVAQTDSHATQRGAAWLESLTIGSVGQQADAIVALAAAGRSHDALRARLEAMRAGASGYAASAGAAGKVVLATVAAGEDPRSFGGVDYVARIERHYRSGRYGTTAYDQAYAMLALRAAGSTPPRAALTAVRNARGSGGWGFALRRTGSDDVSATGLTIEAMRAAGVPRTDAALRAATVWLAAQVNARGGLHIDGKRKPTETNSTAIAIRALRAMGRTPPATMRRELRSLQEADGGFRFTRRTRENRLFATVDAVLALSGRRLPPPY